MRQISQPLKPPPPPHSRPCGQDSVSVPLAPSGGSAYGLRFTLRALTLGTSPTARRWKMPVVGGYWRSLLVWSCLRCRSSMNLVWSSRSALPRVLILLVRPTFALRATCSVLALRYSGPPPQIARRSGGPPPLLAPGAPLRSARATVAAAPCAVAHSGTAVGGLRPPRFLSVTRG